MALAEERADGLYPLLYDALRARGHRPTLHLVPGADGGHRRAWLSAAGLGALGTTIEHAARLYVQAGASLVSEPSLRDELARIAGMLGAARPTQ